MPAPNRKAELESALGPRFGTFFSAQARPVPPPRLSTGIPEVDACCGGLPRGAITEVCGPASSGRTSLLCAALAQATVRGEACALVDASDAFDPASAAAAGMDFRRLLWVRPASPGLPVPNEGRQQNHALRITDLLVAGGGFGLVALDLGDIAPRDARRIPLSAWFRLRRAIEHTPTVLLLISREPYAAASSSLLLEMRSGGALWQGKLFMGTEIEVGKRKPAGSAIAFQAMRQQVMDEAMDEER